MNIVSDESKLDEESLKLVKSLYDFMKNKFDFSCEPKINFISDVENSKQILCKTGFYDPDEESINVFITNRHPKDILRSFAHELLHHIQGCEGLMKHHDMSSAKDPNYIMHDDFLKKIEADAFERGNITFREWEACQKGENMINESKQIEEKKKRKKSKKKKLTKSKLKLAHKKAKKALKMGGFEQYGSRAKEVAYATMTKQAMAEGEMEEISYEKSGLKHPEKSDLNKPKDKDISPYELRRGRAIEKSMRRNLKESKEPEVADKKEVEVNETLKNSHNYSTVTRALPEVAAARDEFVYQELLKKFGIKK